MAKEYGLSRSLRKLGLKFIKCEKCGSGFTSSPGDIAHMHAVHKRAQDASEMTRLTMDRRLRSET